MTFYTTNASNSHDFYSVLGEIRIVSPGNTCIYPYPMCKKSLVFMAKIFKTNDFVGRDNIFFFHKIMPVVCKKKKGELLYQKKLDFTCTCNNRKLNKCLTNDFVKLIKWVLIFQKKKTKKKHTL